MRRLLHKPFRNFSPYFVEVTYRRARKKNRSGRYSLKYVGTKECGKHMPQYYEDCDKTAIWRFLLERQLKLGDIAWLKGRCAAIFSVSMGKLRPESRIFGFEAGREPRLLARIPMSSPRLHVVGTRVLCRERNGTGKVIIFDLWNPDSIRGEGVNVTDIRNLFPLPPH